jgi:hypothetical protein
MVHGHAVACAEQHSRLRLLPDIVVSVSPVKPYGSDKGYNRRNGNRDEYRETFRQGFKRGYSDGYRANERDNDRRSGRR